MTIVRVATPAKRDSPSEDSDNESDLEPEKLVSSSSSASLMRTQNHQTKRARLASPTSEDRIEELPRRIIIKALDPEFDGKRVTSAECGIPGRQELLIIEE